ncbi:sensor domain-containing diguanylate cyclase [Agarivorans sp. QJM3NY_29]|uniref:sensor domain-containing diguanylate cyclase n=1 Tax=unclassified Agarivorans TaxID=2636026 RepID=UPI003D7F1042
MLLKKTSLKFGIMRLMSRKIYLFFTFCFLFFGILVALFTSLVNYRMQVVNIDNALALGFKNEKASKTHVLEEFLAGFDASLSSIASNPITQRYMVEQSVVNMTALEEFLLGIIASKPIFMQLRLLDHNGVEVVRLNQDDLGKISFTPHSQLQNKSQRYYFQEVSKLSQNQHWHSRVDLNMENEQVELPYRPTIRAATPLYQEGEFFGMLIINVDFSEVLQTLTNSSEFTIFVVDKEGEILYHPNAALAWSAYIPGRKSFDELYSTFNNGIYEMNIEAIINNNEGLKLVMLPQQSLLDAMHSNNRYTALVIAGIVLLISFPLSWLVALFPARLQKRLSQTLEALLRSDQLLDKHVITSHTDVEGIITKVSERMCCISEYSKEELLGKTHSMLKHPAVSSQVHTELWGTITKGEEWHGELRDCKKTGEEYWLNSKIMPEYDEDQKLIGYAQVAQDITSEKVLERLSVTDPLTQLFNRHKLNQVLVKELERFYRYDEVFSVVIIDLDHFKSINDTWGHQAGDETLVKVSQRLKMVTRKVDYVGRWGGEEFLVISPSTKLDGAKILAEKLRVAIEELDFSHQYKVTASMGVAASQESQSAEQLVASADKALYQAKSSGRNRVIVASIENS